MQEFRSETGLQALCSGALRGKTIAFCFRLSQYVTMGTGSSAYPHRCVHCSLCFAMVFLCAFALLQPVLKVLRYALVQVNALVARHVVPLAWVDEEVGLLAGLYAGLKELQRVLRHHGWVVGADDYL